MELCGLRENCKNEKALKVHIEQKHIEAEVRKVLTCESCGYTKRHISIS